MRLSDTAKKQLGKFDHATAARIAKFLSSRLAPIADPRSIGHALAGSELGEFWRYRVGDYRIICEIHDKELVILALSIGHRRKICR